MSTSYTSSVTGGVPLPKPDFLEHSLADPHGISPFTHTTSASVQPGSKPDSVSIAANLFRQDTSTGQSRGPDRTRSRAATRPHTLTEHYDSHEEAILPRPQFPMVDVDLPKTPTPLSDPSSGSSVASSQPVDAKNHLPTINLGKFKFVSTSSS